MMKTGTETSAYFVKKVANAEDESSGDSFEIFLFAKVNGRKGKVVVERDKARDVDHLHRLFLKKNAALPSDDGTAKALIQAAIDREPIRYDLHAKHVGWRPKRAGFVLKGSIIRPPDALTSLKPPIWINHRQVGSLKTRGSLEDWQRLVAEPAVYSTRMMLMLSAAFAAPLLKVVNAPNFGVNLYGLSKVGKTTALLVATSVVGIGQERDLPNWNATSGAFLETARTFNDLLLAINEVGLLAGKRGDAYGPIRERIYCFSEGVDRARMSTSSLASSSSSQWRGIFVSTSEYSFNEYAAFSGEARSEGEFARCLDVAAAVRGMPTVFDRRPDEITKAAAGRWARRQLIKLRGACERQCGTALASYIAYLVDQGRDLPKAVRARRTQFMTQMKRLKLDGALDHAAKNFALIFAGGSLAIDAGILPWEKEALLEAIGLCFEAAVFDIRGHANALEAAKRQLRKRLRSGDLVERTAVAIFGPNDHAAYIERRDNKIYFTVTSKAFAGWFDNRAQIIAILRWLYEQGLLDIGDKRISPSMKSTDWAERQRRWPNGANPRSFTFAAPFDRSE